MYSICLSDISSRIGVLITAGAKEFTVMSPLLAYSFPRHFVKPITAALLQ